MGMPASKLRNLQSWMLEERSSAYKNNIEICETGVPAKHSLYWSVMMSYLLANSNLSNNILEKLTGDENVVNEIKEKKNMMLGKFDLKEIQREVKAFNPFKNRHVTFFRPNLVNVFRIFKLRLDIFSNKIKSKYPDWNDELKLQGASKMLCCQIKVYFPDERGHKKSFGDDLSTKIILFQYKDQQCGSKTEKCNIFYFGMDQQHAHILKLNALGHILNKAKISKEAIEHIKKLMNSSEKHGKCFLPTLLQSEYVYIYHIYTNLIISLLSRFRNRSNSGRRRKTVTLMLCFDQCEHTIYSNSLRLCIELPLFIR